MAVESFQLAFPAREAAGAVKTTSLDDTGPALRALGLGEGRAAIVLVGGARELALEDAACVWPLFLDCLAPAAQAFGAVVVDGGTDSGVMRLMGKARRQQQATFPLLGVAVERLVTWPGGPAGDERIELEANHSHFLLAAGETWGDEAPWLAAAATAIAGHHPSVTILINGGPLAMRDAQESMRAGRTLIVLRGSGRLADDLSWSGHEVGGLARTENWRPELVTIVDLAGGSAALSLALEAIMRPGR